MARDIALAWVALQPAQELRSLCIVARMATPWSAAPTHYSTLMRDRKVKSGEGAGRAAGPNPFYLASV